MTRDPLGEYGDVNLYRMVANNPVNFVDPLGLDAAGFIIKLTKTGFKKIKPLLSKAEAVAARKAKMSWQRTDNARNKLKVPAMKGKTF